MWVGLDGEEIVCAHVPRLRKVENIVRDPRVALSMEGAGVGEPEPRRLQLKQIRSPRCLAGIFLSRCIHQWFAYIKFRIAVQYVLNR